MMFFWVWEPCGPAGRSQRFGEAYCLHLQGWSYHAGNQRDYIGWQEGKSEGRGQSGRSEVEIDVGPLGRLQAGVSGGGAGEGRRKEVNPFQGPRDGVIPWWETDSVLSGHEWEVSMPDSGRSHLPCSGCRDGARSLSLPLWPGPSVSTSWPEYWCSAVVSDGLGWYCVPPPQTSRDGTDGYVGDVL
jgi:hypothetical protein